jgi:hypothetical protein
VWVYKGGKGPPERNYSNVNYHGCNLPGIFYRHDEYYGHWEKKLKVLIPEALRVMRGGKDATEEAIDGRKRTIPIKGGYGIRQADEVGMCNTSVRLVKLTPNNYRRAIDAALSRNHSQSKLKSGKPSKPSKPILYKSHLYQLSYCLSEQITARNLLFG